VVIIALGCVALGEVQQRRAWLEVRLRAQHQLTCRQALAWVGVVDLAVLAAWGGHSALEGSTSLLTVMAKTGHLVGLGLWVGVLAVVLVMSATSRSRRAALSAMSQVALVGAFMTVTSGLVLASHLVVSITALEATTYGRYLALKIGLLAVAAVLGIRMRRRSGARWPVAELGVLSVVVLLGAAMATATPAVDPGFVVAHASPVELPIAIAADDLLLRARAIPARPGVNSVELRIGETRRPAPGEITSVDLEVDDTRYTAIPNDQGHAFLDGVTLPAGETATVVVVHRAGLADTVATLDVMTAAPAYVHPVWISSARLRDPLLAVALLVVAAGWLVVRPRRTEATHEEPARDAAADVLVSESSAVSNAGDDRSFVAD
jgi:copper transport protein